MLTSAALLLSPSITPTSALPRFQTDADRFEWIARRAASTPPPFAKVTAIRNSGARAFDLSVEEITGPKRDPWVMVPRSKLICLARILTGATTARISFLFDRDHATVIHAYKNFFEDVLLSVYSRNVGCSLTPFYSDNEREVH